jgi:uncharacterized GH25 family protein
MRKSLLWLAPALLVGVAFAGDKTADKYASVKFVVVRDYNGKPVRNASVVLHQIDKKGQQEKGGLQLKTDPEGRASFDYVPYGKLRVQVIASGFQTYGEDHEVAQPEHEIVVKLKRPQEQHSIYK